MKFAHYSFSTDLRIHIFVVSMAPTFYVRTFPTPTPLLQPKGLKMVDRQKFSVSLTQGVGPVFTLVLEDTT